MSFFLRKPPVSVVVERWAEDARATAKKHIQDAEKQEAYAELAFARARHFRKLAAMYDNLAQTYVEEGAKVSTDCIGAGDPATV